MRNFNMVIGSYLYRAFSALSSSVRREDGQTLVEYALILALIAIALVVSLDALSTGVSTEFSKITASLP